MSWRRKDFPTYNRMETKEDTQYWLHLYEINYYDEWSDWDEYGWGVEWWDYAGGGHVPNMESYHSMKVLTLLCSLRLAEARTEAQNRGWYK